jgi:hypothetical protein
MAGTSPAAVAIALATLFTKTKDHPKPGQALMDYFKGLNEIINDVLLKATSLKDEVDNGNLDADETASELEDVTDMLGKIVEATNDQRAIYDAIMANGPVISPVNVGTKSVDLSAVIGGLLGINPSAPRHADDPKAGEPTSPPPPPIPIKKAAGHKPRKGKNDQDDGDSA